MNFQTLHDRVQRHARIRFNTARRLRQQNRVSLWTVSLLSVALILVSLWTALELPLGFDAELLNAMEVFFAVLVLVYSLLLNLEDYSVRSERMHTCALELGNLKGKIEVYLPPDEVPGNRVDYDLFSEEFSSIIHRYEDHEVVDYLHYRLTFAQEQGLEGSAYARVFLAAWLRHFMGFAHYVVISLFIFVFIAWMIFRAPAR